MNFAIIINLFYFFLETHSCPREWIKKQLCFQHKEIKSAKLQTIGIQLKYAYINIHVKHNCTSASQLSTESIVYTGES